MEKVKDARKKARVAVATMFGKAPMTGKVLRGKACYVDNDQLMGVELEYENAGTAANYMRDSLAWGTHEDGSLRNGGIEFVLNKPRCGEELSGAVNEFFKNTRGSGLIANGRTSCHLHVNMSEPETTRDRLQGNIVVYNALEDLFWKQCHKQRRWSGYCMPLLEAQPVLVANLMRPKNGYAWGRNFNAANRYSALNLAALARMGSLEYRHFQNPESEEQLNGWIDLTHLVKAAGNALGDAYEDELVDTITKDPSIVAKTIHTVVKLREILAGANINTKTIVDRTEELLAVVEVLQPTAAEMKELKGLLPTPEPLDTLPLALQDFVLAFRRAFGAIIIGVGDNIPTRVFATTLFELDWVNGAITSSDTMSMLMREAGFTIAETDAVARHFISENYRQHMRNHLARVL